MNPPNSPSAQTDVSTQADADDQLAGLNADERAALCRCWDSVQKLLGTSDTERDCMAGEGKPPDAACVLRIMHLYAAAFAVLGARSKVTAWFRAPNAVFEGRSAMQVVTQDAGGVERVTLYLKAIIFN